jgi:hypothetical protein
MKNFKLLLLAFVAVLGTSCGNDDDATGFALSTDNFAGVYNVTFFTSVETEIVTVGNSDVTSETTIVGDTFTNAIYTFNLDGSYVFSGSYVANETNKINGSTVDTDSYVEEFDDNGTYTIDIVARTITFGTGIDSIVIDISGFSATGATLKQNDVDGADSYRAEVRLVKR